MSTTEKPIARNMSVRMGNQRTHKTEKRARAKGFLP